MQISKLDRFFNFGSLLVLSILYLNLFSSCVLTISCESFIPTLSYLATFRTHDAVVLIALTLQSFLLVVLFFAFHACMDGDLGRDDYYFMKIQECAIVILTVLVGIIDESSGIDFNPVDDVHRFLSFALCGTGCLWSYWALTFLERKNNSLEQELQLRIASTVYTLGVIFSALTIIEWEMAYTIYNNWIFNHIVESCCEWILITLAVRFPYHLCKLMESKIVLIVHDKAKN